jgi:hypothetical protein
MFDLVPEDDHADTLMHRSRYVSTEGSTILVIGW